MDSNAPAVERLRWYIRKQAPQTQKTILMALERGILRGEDMPALQFVMTELRSELRTAADKPKRVGSPARLFFEPIGPFIVDGAPARRHDGHIARASLNPIWSWICRDLVPLDAKGYVEMAARALLAHDQGTSEKLAHALHERVIERVGETLDGAKAEARARERLTAYMAPARALDDLRDLVQVFKSRDSLAAVGAQLPPAIIDFDGDQVDATVELLRSTGDAAERIVLYAGVLIMRRLERRWQLVRLATRAADTRSARRLAASPYHAAVTLVLADIEQTVAAHRAKLAAGHVGASLDLLAAAHRAMQAVAAELDFSEDSPTSRRYAALRSAASQAALRPVVEAEHARQRAAQPRPASEPADTPDAFVAPGEAELMIRVLRSVQGQEAKLRA
jgi:hypothetical protein